MFEEFQHEDHHHAVPYAEDEVEEYDDVGIPTFLKWTYFLLPIWGVLWAYCFWDGSFGWFDRGYWEELEALAQTKLSIQNVTSSRPGM